MREIRGGLSARTTHVAQEEEGTDETEAEQDEGQERDKEGDVGAAETVFLATRDELAGIHDGEAVDGRRKRGGGQEVMGGEGVVVCVTLWPTRVAAGSMNGRI